MHINSGNHRYNLASLAAHQHHTTARRGDCALHARSKVPSTCTLVRYGRIDRNSNMPTANPHVSHHMHVLKGTPTSFSFRAAPASARGSISIQQLPALDLFVLFLHFEVAQDVRPHHPQFDETGESFVVVLSSIYLGFV